MNNATPEPHAAGPAAMQVTCAAATLWLMSHYTRLPCPLIAHAIADQLGHLARSCSEGSSPALRKLAEALLPQWQRIASGSAYGIQH